MKPRSPQIIISFILVLTMALCGCATTGDQPTGQSIYLSPEGQRALARTISWTVGVGVCTARPEIAPIVGAVSEVLSGEGASVEALGDWARVLTQYRGIDNRIEDLLIILQDQFVLDANYKVNVSEVASWVRECAKAMHEGCVPTG